ncbi:MAG TPA: hypothetical protein VKS22_01710 [Candidatus Binataceae bacterium]|nr:hypothetical protein [Candidatus Binataceae bacterium]
MFTKNRMLRSLVIVATWIPLAAGVAHAHGGMAGPDEMGPPVGTAIAIGLACYYLITLWPRRGENDGRKSTTRASERGR